MTLPLPLGSISSERNRRLQSRSGREVEAEIALAESLSGLSDELLAARVRTAYEFARTLDYHHPDLTTAAYLAHPVRVACMALKVVEPLDGNVVVLALLHNVFEVTCVAAEEITARFGRPMTEAIQTLTVDRSQGGRDYCSRYYGRLQDAPRWVRVVKALDKLDNLFLLCLNPSAERREAYLADVEEHVIPMAEADLPRLTRYLRLLVDDCREIGFCPEGRSPRQEQGA